MQEVGALLPIPFAQLAAAWLIAINLIAFLAFGLDKARARSGGWRIREDTLAGFVVLGGLPGALAGRALFRHKTRKRSFSEKLWGAAIANVLLVAGGWYLLSDAQFLRSPEEQARLDAVMASVTYSGCSAVRAAGKAPLHYGEPGYRTTMDGDGDGIACEARPD
jgi:uncharacterized membrane protein YsdA (DUF1294 family)